MGRRFWTSGAPAALLAFFGMAWVAAMTLQPRVGEPVAAIFSPFAGGEAAMLGVLRAKADVVIAVGGMSTIIVTASPDGDFVERLKRAGALAVIRAPIGGSCKS